MKIIDNFLFYDYFKELQKLIYSDNFSWYYQKTTTTYMKKLKNSIILILQKKLQNSE